MKKLFLVTGMFLFVGLMFFNVQNVTDSNDLVTLWEFEQVEAIAQSENNEISCVAAYLDCNGGDCFDQNWCADCTCISMRDSQGSGMCEESSSQ